MRTLASWCVCVLGLALVRVSAQEDFAAEEQRRMLKPTQLPLPADIIKIVPFPAGFYGDSPQRKPTREFLERVLKKGVLVSCFRSGEFDKSELLAKADTLVPAGRQEPDPARPAGLVDANGVLLTRQGQIFVYDVIAPNAIRLWDSNGKCGLLVL